MIESSDDEESTEIDNHVIIDTNYVIDVDHIDEDYMNAYVIDDVMYTTHIPHPSVYNPHTSSININDESLESLEDDNDTPSLEPGGLETLQMFDASPEEVLRGITIPLTPNAPLRPIMTHPRMS